MVLVDEIDIPPVKEDRRPPIEMGQYLHFQAYGSYLPLKPTRRNAHIVQRRIAKQLRFDIGYLTNDRTPLTDSAFLSLGTIMRLGPFLILSNSRISA